MHLAKLSIRDFRGIRHADLALNQHNVFIGANNSGKTTIVEALALLFGRDRMVRSLTEHDFFGGNPGAAQRIRRGPAIFVGILAFVTYQGAFLIFNR